MSGALRIERVLTEGTFALDGGEWNVDNNIWLIGDDPDVVIVDAAHAAQPIIDAVGDRHVNAVICTHGHNDHVTVAPRTGRARARPGAAAPRRRRAVEDAPPRRQVLASRGRTAIAIAGTEIQVIHSPGHSPGSVCLYLPEAGALFSGDTLFSGGPGATGRSYSDFPTIIGSIRDRLFTLPEETLVHTGHGDGTTIGTEAPHLAEWIARGQ